MPGEFYNYYMTCGTISSEFLKFFTDRTIKIQSSNIVYLLEQDIPHLVR